ncbi:hypothetical protein AVEN_41468-1 [Araneus ventricosus]|uniref:Uncharacterized protein n=1 Tax=Araneus ventricosus TaxID=182803 RepID=A0A4Y2F4E7_ARAVE|nr:hypothetical protein AVEN_41468-1 [Araneus ventricosus]
MFLRFTHCILSVLEHRLVDTMPVNIQFNTQYIRNTGSYLGTDLLHFELRSDDEDVTPELPSPNSRHKTGGSLPLLYDLACNRPLHTRCDLLWNRGFEPATLGPLVETLPLAIPRPCRTGDFYLFQNENLEHGRRKTIVKSKTMENHSIALWTIWISNQTKFCRPLEPILAGILVRVVAVQNDLTRLGPVRGYLIKTWVGKWGIEEHVEGRAPCELLNE